MAGGGGGATVERGVEAGVLSGARTWDQNPNDSAWNDTARSLIGWKFRTPQAAVFYVIVACNDGQERYLMYLTGEGTDSKDCRYLRFYLGANLTDNTWKSIERDVRADLARARACLEVARDSASVTC